MCQQESHFNKLGRQRQTGTRKGLRVVVSLFPVQCSRHHNPQLIETKKKKKLQELRGLRDESEEREGACGRFCSISPEESEAECEA